MATDLVTNALTNLYSLYGEERELMQFIDQEKEKLGSNLSAIKSVLQDAEETQLRGTSRELDDWLQKLEDALFLLDDILGECSIEAIRDKYEGDRSCSFLSFLQPGKIMFRHNISGRMKAIREKLDFIAEEKNRFGLAPADAAAERQTSANLLSNILRGRQTSSAMTEDCPYGREKDKDQLVRQLLEDGSHAENLMVHTIVGIGGLGKTTLAQLVYHDKKVQDHFQLKVWICVSVNFELETLIKSILGTPQSDDHLETLQRKLRDTLQGKRYLLVLDDVWNDDQEKWNQFRCLLSCGSKGSSVLVTTRQEKIAATMKTTLQPYHLTGLSEEACWQVFSKRAFGLSVVEETKNLVTIGKEIVTKCRGVPLAAKALGGLLSFTADEKAWVRVMKSELWNLANAADSIFGALRLSYLNLPTRFRRCFTFCAVFPKDYRIEKEHIIHLWMANDLIPSESMIGTTSEIEDVGNEIVNELHWRSLIEDISKDKYGDIFSFKMHDLVHDLAQSIMGDVICAVDGTTTPRELKPRTRHVLFSYKVESGMINELLKNVKGLRTCITARFAPQELFMILSTHTSLRALDLSTAHLIDFTSSICVLKHLRYLNLSHNKIVELPESICNLWNLQILNLDWCDRLKTLPPDMGRLRSLRHLCMRYCGRLSSMPMGMGSLTSLRSLSLVIVGESEKLGFQLSALGRFKNIKGEMEIVHLERVSDMRHAQEANLMEKSDLDRLTFVWGRGNLFFNMGNNRDMQHEMQILEALRPSLNLKYLKVSNYGCPSFPQWMMNDIGSFTYLRILCLEYCENCTQLPPLWRLPCLKTLELNYLYSLRYLIEGERGSLGQIMYDSCFHSLERLTLELLPSLEGVVMGNDNEEEVEAEMNKKNSILLFPRLSSLTVSQCHRLRADWGPLPSLRYLKIDNKVTLPLFNPSNVHYLNSLDELDIMRFHSLESLPDQTFQRLSLLRKLSISFIDDLKSLPEGLKYLSSLEEMNIRTCEQLIDISNVVHLPSLRTLTIWGLPISSFDNSATTGSAMLRDNTFRFPALQNLRLTYCKNLDALPDWLGDALFLERIGIRVCTKLASIPDCFQLLTNLKSLSIYCCPVLSMRCRKEIGEDWNNIAHVPDIFLDGTQI